MTTTTTAATTAPAASQPGRAWQVVRWGGRKLAAGASTLLWSLGVTAANPRPGHWPAGDQPWVDPLSRLLTTRRRGLPASAARPQPAAPTRREPPGAGGTTPPPRARGELQQRLATAIAAGPPGGGVWTGRALAAHVGCARSTAARALTTHRQQPAGTTKPGRDATKPRTGRQPDRSTRRARRQPRTDRER